MRLFGVPHRSNRLVINTLVGFCGGLQLLVSPTRKFSQLSLPKLISSAQVTKLISVQF